MENFLTSQKKKTVDFLTKLDNNSQRLNPQNTFYFQWFVEIYIEAFRTVMTDCVTTPTTGEITHLPVLSTHVSMSWRSLESLFTWKQSFSFVVEVYYDLDFYSKLLGTFIVVNLQLKVQKSLFFSRLIKNSCFSYTEKVFHKFF